MKKRIFNLLILDESGSMSSVKKETIDNINETLQTIKTSQKENPEQEYFVSLVTFNSKSKTLYDCVNVENVKEITHEDYYPNCSTALYDTMGDSLNKLRKHVAEEDNVLVTIITDGYENASVEYKREQIQALVQDLKSKGWVFVYLGANHDVEKVAYSISITNTMKFEANHQGMEEMTRELNDGRSRMYRRMSEPDFDTKAANTGFFNKD